MKFNEDSRVKIPAILHLTRLGYTYLSLKELNWDESSNIIPSIFRKSLSAALNPSTPVKIENALGQNQIRAYVYAVRNANRDCCDAMQKDAIDDWQPGP
jgi:hypothetical protein